MKKIIGFITSWQLLLLIQAAASALLGYMAITLGAIPTKYTIPMIVVLAVLLLLMFFFTKPQKKTKRGKNKKGIRPVIGKILSLLLSIAMVVGTSYVSQLGTLLNKVTQNANTQTVTYSLIALKSSSASSVNDIEGQTVGTYNSADATNLAKATSALKDKISYTATSASDFATLADKLYNKKADAILVSEAYRDLLATNHTNFDSETKVIWSYAITIQTEDISDAVNVTKEPFSIYISGIDTYGKISTVSRSDVNMIVTIDPVNKKILMTSIPRDYYVTLATYNAKDKLTHSGIYGINETIKTIEKNFDINLNYYARVNFSSLVKIVNAIGGITVTIPKSFRAYSDGTIFKKGTQTLNGKQALAYARERHAFGGGDNTRIAHQQQVLQAILKKCMSPSIISNYSSLLDSLSSSFQTSMSSSDIKKIINMQLDDSASWNFTSQAMDGKGKLTYGCYSMPKYKLYVQVPSQSSVNKCVAAIKAITGEN